MRLTLLTGPELRRLVPMPDAIEAMRSAFSQLSGGEAVVPLRTPVAVDGGVTLFMPGYLQASRILGGKVVSVFGGNRARGLPAIHAVVMILDAETGAPRALLEGTVLTALRTGAASGLATELLAAPDAGVLAVFGAGPQARTQVEAVRAVRDVREIRLVSRTGASARTFAAELRACEDPPEVRVLENPEAAVVGADVVVTATDSRAPVFPGRAVSPGVHVNGVGSFEPGMQEVDEELVRRATVVVDSREAALSEAGDLVVPLERGIIEEGHVQAELGEVVRGDHPGRSRVDEVTFFKSVGSAAQDLAVAAVALEAATRTGEGRTVEL